jgi:hypothetical protein
MVFDLLGDTFEERFNIVSAKVCVNRHPLHPYLHKPRVCNRPQSWHCCVGVNRHPKRLAVARLLAARHV